MAKMTFGVSAISLPWQKNAALAGAAVRLRIAQPPLLVQIRKLGHGAGDGFSPIVP
ncbi:hypothetical protein [Bradyrhizobium sp. JYMT SZCCT0428]|uniref:hypothetical protein n=1 Tax=Bradyrhizobium sp. JYMT SZCCT0428 TaxID=2807673 RepID=UPI001BAB13BB|nr:hypothetical protein [Bradyrhizobium sp. JYMT SZCCT0428]MBR1152806.1 hypothetical protein [Bradyrhizobium sp. JYMT SZCCT0428]